MKRFKKLVSVLTLTAMLAASLTAHLPMPSPGTLQRLSMLLQHLTVGDYLL